MGFYKVGNVQTAIPFIIGDKSKIVAGAQGGGKRKKLAAKKQKVNGNASENTDVGEAVGGLLKGVFGLK